MKVYRPATVEDGTRVALNLRKEDKAELYGMGVGLSHIPYGLTCSEHATVFHNYQNEIAGVGGIVPLPDGSGSIWMLCTPAVYHMKTTLFRQTERWLKEVETDYTMLSAYTDCRNKAHHRLLKFLGFRALRVVLVAPYQLPYLEVVRLCVSQQR